MQFSNSCLSDENILKEFCHSEACCSIAMFTHMYCVFVSGTGNPFTSPNRHPSPSVTPTPNPFNQPPPPAASSHPVSGSPATVNAGSNRSQPSYPPSFNPFL